MTDDEQDFFNKSIGKLEEEIIALKKEYQAECNRADELEDSLHISWQNENKLKELLKECQYMILAYSINNNTFIKEKVRDIVKQIDNTIGEKK